ncbi:MAG: 2-oxoacid:acceptor oxidoreductase family protein [Deltaproteobacteria bacterium]|nr:2-oxoacid:acceptor oxidoreductase family protein [Deltaproteobacteria bacterium]MBN2671803.1 2-oxoacid:acceptor oxidoreductase family protein [Deltaproteobacteria bacterium]
MTINVKIAGLGGMGVLKSSLILAEVAFQEGYDVKKSEVHGMAQRGGSVCSDVRFGNAVKSPMIPEGAVDYLLLFEEADMPLYQRDINETTRILRASLIDAAQLPSRKSLNVAMLGALSALLSIPQTRWVDAIHRLFPDKLRAANDGAFALGFAAGKEFL